MGWLVPLGSSILGAVIGGASLLGGQHWNSLRLCRNNSRIIFMAFMREASWLDYNILRIGCPKNCTNIICIDVQTQVFHDHEKYLIKCIDPVIIGSIYEKVKKIEKNQNSIIQPVNSSDNGKSYLIVRSIQDNLIQILDQLKPHTFSRFDKKSTRSVDNVVCNLKLSFQAFSEAPCRGRHFLLVPSRRGNR